MSHERLLNVLEQVLGPRVAASPVWNVRSKTPNCINGEIPWHQGMLTSAGTQCRVGKVQSSQVGTETTMANAQAVDNSGRCVN